MTDPAPEIAPANVLVSDRLKTRKPLSTTSPRTEPPAPPLPIWGAPAEIVVPPAADRRPPSRDRRPPGVGVGAGQDEGAGAGLGEGGGVAVLGVVGDGACQ